MSKFCKLMVAAAISVSMTGLPAQAAEVLGQLDNVSGSVLIQRDGEFLKATTNSQVMLGDRVVAIDGARAGVNLLAGCSINVDDTNTVTISSPLIGAADICDTVFAVSKLEVTDPVYDVSVGSLQIAGVAPLVFLLASAAVVATIVVVTDNDEPSSP